MPAEAAGKWLPQEASAMPAAANKTQMTDADVDRFVAALPEGEKRNDAAALLEIMRQVTKLPAKMWGPSIIGLGDAHYIYETGREGDWFFIGFAPRKAALTLYTIGGWPMHGEELKDLGKHTLGGGCLYIKRLSDVKLPVLKKAVQVAFKYAQQDAKKTVRPSGYAEARDKKKAAPQKTTKKTVKKAKKK
jgi:hypothetical protein